MHNATTIKGHSMKNASGMTLIELSVVMLLTMMAASLTLPLFVGITQNTKSQITAARITQIKQAIINVQTVNGTPTVSGFVADVGRLPYCIQELINGICPPNTTSIIGPNIWKGPYIHTSDGSFYDGWGNQKESPDIGNFGWNFQRSTTAYTAPSTLTVSTTVCSYGGTPTLCDTLSLQSYGADGTPDASTTNLCSGSYDNDYPASISNPSNQCTPKAAGTIAGMPVLIQPSDWIIDLSATGLNVQFNHLPSAYSAISPPPTISTSCNVEVTAGTPTPTAPQTATLSLTGTSAYSFCPTNTTSVTSTITCPTGYTAPPSTYTPPISGQTVYSYCQPTTGSISTVTVTCLDGFTPGSSSASVITCTAPTALTNGTISTTALTTTPLSTCASGVPVTLLILANDLYGNSIIPTPPPPGAPWILPLPSNSCQSANTINYNDSTETIVVPTPMAIGNWNICAFQASTILPTSAPVAGSPTFPTDFPLSISSLSSTPTPCSGAVMPTGATTPTTYPYLSSSAALYNSTITVLPRTQPSVAW